MAAPHFTIVSEKYATSATVTQQSVKGPRFITEERIADGPRAGIAGPPFLGKLIWEAKMAMASRDHVMDHGPKGLVGHKGSDGTTPFDRV